MPSEKLSKNPIEKGQKKESILKMEDFYKEINKIKHPDFGRGA